jgi:4-diphosphocytidyl-2-C-methyl-D-erythritol kinase
MTPADVDLKGLWIVLVKPDEGVSTREAYAGVKPRVPERTLSERLQEPVECWQGSVKNDFEPSVFASHPALAVVKQHLLDSGAIYASMSGSGSTIYALFDSGAKAERLRSLTDYIFKL